MATTTVASPTSAQRHRSFIAAMAVDSIGAGVFQPASTIYLLATTDLTLPQVGSALTIAGIAALPVGLWLGGLVDRIGPRPVLMAANVAQAVGMAGYLLLHSFWGVIASAFIASAGRGVFFGSLGVAVSTIAGSGGVERWFAKVGGIRNLGQAAGALIAAVALGIGTHSALVAIILFTSASLLAAVPLLTGVPRRPGDRATPARGSWGVVLRDRRYRIVVAHWIAFSLSAYVLGVAIPVYAAVVLHMPGWVAGAAFMVNTLLIGFGQERIVRTQNGRIRSRVLVGSHIVYAIGFLTLLAASIAHGALAIGILVVGVIIYTLGEVAGWPVGASINASAAPEELRGRYQSLIQFSQSGVGAVAPGALSGLLAIGAAATWLPMVGVCAIGAGLSALMGAKVPAARARIGQP